MTYHRIGVAIGKLSPEKISFYLDIVKIALDTYKELMQEKVQIKKNLETIWIRVTPPTPLWTMSKSKQMFSRDRFP